MDMAKRDHSRMGLGVFVMLVIASVAQIIAYVAVDPRILRDGVTALVLSYAPLYCIAFPTAYLIIRTVPKRPLERRYLGAKSFFVLIVICVFLMYGGNIFGTLVNYYISDALGVMITDPVDSLLMSGIPMPVLFVLTVILAPFFEELMFRRLLIDRLNVYGQGTAVITTALMFGLFHGNLSQFFYAMALGLVFGYVYVKTGKLRYSVCMHMIINFWGGIVSGSLVTDESVIALINGNIDPENIMGLLTPQVILFGLYTLVTMALAVAGLVLLIRYRGRITLDAAEMQIPKGRVFGTVWINPGMILFTLACLAMMLFTIYSDLLF